MPTSASDVGSVSPLKLLREILRSLVASAAHRFLAYSLKIPDDKIMLCRKSVVAAWKHEECISMVSEAIYSVFSASTRRRTTHGR